MRRLEELFAERIGHEAALFVPSGTMGNQIALRLLARPGTAVAIGRRQHPVIYELGAAGVNGRAQFDLLDDKHGVLPLDALADAIEAEHHHWLRSAPCASRTRTCRRAVCRCRSSTSRPSPRSGFRCTSTGRGCSTRRWRPIRRLPTTAGWRRPSCVASRKGSGPGWFDVGRVERSHRCGARRAEAPRWGHATSWRHRCRRHRRPRADGRASCRRSRPRPRARGSSGRTVVHVRPRPRDRAHELRRVHASRHEGVGRSPPQPGRARWHDRAAHDALHDPRRRRRCWVEAACQAIATAP